MKNTGYSIIFVLLSLASLLLSCRREALPEPVLRGSVHGEEVFVNLSLAIGRAQAGTPDAAAYVDIVDTKAVDDLGDGITTAIKDFYVLQFDGVTDSSKLIGSAQHFDYAQFVSGANPYGANYAKLVASSQPDAVFILANTCDSTMVFPYGMTIAELKSRVKDINAQEDLFGKGDPGSGTAFPGDRTYHIMLNGQLNRRIAPGDSLNIALRRNVAKIMVNISNKTASTDCPVTIRSLSLHNVPNTSRYFTNTEEQPEYVPSSELIQTFNYPAEEYKPEGNVFYVPMNKRGTKDNTTQNSKGMNAPPSSTYLWVDAFYLSGAQKDTVPVIYSYYLGANLKDDYNLLANSTYTYNITISDKGDADFDYRVDDWGPVVDFTKIAERANCYILNPAPAGDRQFRIPIDRIRTFWGGEGMTATKGYERYDPAISADSLMRKTFDAYILWTDIENTNGDDGIYNTSDDLVKVDMTNTHDDYSYFTVTVKPGTEGNAVVVVTTINGAGQEEIMWSWHLWITDYRPDEIGRYYNKENGKYIYTVTGGAMHRYAGAIWETGIYKDKFIMDRNLGALDTAFVNASTEGKGVLYYQFGRKDPLPGMKSNGTQRPAVYYPKPGLSDDLKHKAIEKSNAGATFTDTTAIRYSVSHPLAFIIMNFNAGWTLCNKYSPATYNSAIRWQDPNVQSNEGKSLFDPCPPGYKMPEIEVWSDFNSYDAATNPIPTTNIIEGKKPPRNFPIFSNPPGREKDQTGLHYYPGKRDVERTIYYPASGYLYFNSGVCINIGTYGHYWSCNSASSSGASFFYFISTLLYNPSKNTKALGLPVRCIQE